MGWIIASVLLATYAILVTALAVRLKMSNNRYRDREKRMRDEVVKAQGAAKRAKEDLDSARRVQEFFREQSIDVWHNATEAARRYKALQEIEEEEYEE